MFVPAYLNKALKTHVSNKILSQAEFKMEVNNRIDSTSNVALDDRLVH